MESIPVRAFVKKGDRRIRTISDLASADYTTAVINEGAAHVELMRRGGYNLVLKNSVDEGLNALLAGMDDAFIFPEPVLLQKLRTMGLEGFVEAVDEPLLTLKRGYLFRPGDDHLQNFNSILTALIDSPAYAELLNKWYGEPTPFWTAKKVAGYMLVFAGVLCVLLVVWKNYCVGSINKKMRKLASHLPGMIYQFQLNPDGTTRLPYASDGLSALYGAHPEDVKADAAAIFAAVHPLDREKVKTSIQQSAESLDVWKNQHRVLHPSGDIIWVEGHSTPERMPDGSTLWHGFAQDISTRKQAQDLLEKQKIQLEQRNRSLRQFNYAVSHELKTPLVTIESSLGLIQSTLPQATDPELTRAFGYARTAARQMNRLLESLLLIFRIDTEDNSTAGTAFRVLVQDAVDRVIRGNKREGIKMTIAAEGPVLYGDRDKLVQIWLHLIENAAKYMGDQKYPAIDIGVEQTDQELLFYVRDNGMGIEKPYQGKIFGLFDQLDKTADGMGLGLALVQRIVDYYGGTIRVESAGANQGSCFYFTLPDVLINKDRTT